MSKTVDNIAWSNQKLQIRWRRIIWHIQIYFERQVDTAYRKEQWTHMEQLWGSRSLDAQAVFPLSTGEGWQKTGKRPTREQ